MNGNQKSQTIAIMTLGHIDHGKSTTLGHFLYLIGAVDKRTMDKLEAESQELKRQSWKYAYILDSTDEERSGGITADIAFQPFKTKSGKNFMLIDGPGHRDYVKNAIKGAVQTDACILMVSAIPNDLRAGLKEGGPNDPGGQTREHAILGSVLGIESVIICINKIDATNYSEQSFNDAVQSIKSLLKDIHSPWLRTLTEESFVPISGIEGDNLIEKSPKLAWYNGPTLLQSLENLNPIVRKTAPDDLRYLVFDSYDFPGIGNMLYGRLISGILKNDQNIQILPSNDQGTIKDILDIHSESIPELNAGDFGRIQVKGIEKDRLVPGTVICSENTKLKSSTTIICRVLVLETEGKPLIPGSNPLIHVGLSHTSARIQRILKVEKSKKQRKDKSIMIAFPGDLVSLEIKTQNPIIVEKYTDQPILGRLVMRHAGQTIAVGIVTDFFD